MEAAVASAPADVDPPASGDPVALDVSAATATALPEALAEAHAGLGVGTRVILALPPAVAAGSDPSGERLTDVVVGAGFDAPERVSPGEAATGAGAPTITTTRLRTLADRVGPGMRMLLCGLNPSVYSADAGIGFARPGNRLWPAALGAGLVERDRDPTDALERFGIGMTDLVKRATPRADALRPEEYRAGLARVSRLAAWLQPGVVCFVGLTGWRAAAERQAVAGWQPERLGGAAVYLMPSTSGLNAHASLAHLIEHLAARGAAARLPVHPDAPLDSAVPPGEVDDDVGEAERLYSDTLPFSPTLVDVRLATVWPVVKLRFEASGGLLGAAAVG